MAGLGNYFKQCWQEFSDLPLNSDFTKSMFKEIPSLSGASDTTIGTFFGIAQSLDAMKNISGHPRGGEYRKVLDISWTQVQKYLKEKFQANYKKYGKYRYKAKTKKAAVPVRTEPITPPFSTENIPDDAMVVLPAEVYNQMKETLIHQDTTLKEKDKQIEALKKNVADKIDEVQHLETQLRGRKQLVRPDVSFMKKIIPMSGVGKQV